MKRKIIVRYALEFVVIVMGISLSFYIEKTNLNLYNKNLKNISLEKMYVNLSQDLIDLEFNYAVHTDAVKSGKNLIENSEELFYHNKDSLGYHLSLITSAQTIFLDNQEEYTTMKNSGLIELIDNHNLVASLQTRYAETKVFETFDDHFTKLYFNLKGFTFEKISSERKQFQKMYGPISYGIYIGTEPIGNQTMNYIVEKTDFHIFYIQIMKSRIEEDKKILELILEELSVEEIYTKNLSFHDEAQKL